MKDKKDLKLFLEFSKSMRYVFKMVHPRFEEIGLYPGQPQLLKALIKYGQKNQRELADELMIKPSTITVMIQRMEKQGFIKKEQDKKDLRKSVINITDKGIKTLKKFEEVEDDFEKDFDGILSENEQKIFGNLLQKINNELGSRFEENCLKGDD